MPPSPPASSASATARAGRAPRHPLLSVVAIRRALALRAAAGSPRRPPRAPPRRWRRHATARRPGASWRRGSAGSSRGSAAPCPWRSRRATIAICSAGISLLRADEGVAVQAPTCAPAGRTAPWWRRSPGWSCGRRTRPPAPSARRRVKTTIAAWPMTGASPPGPVGSGAMPQSKPAFSISEAREIWLIVIAALPEKIVALLARRHDRLVLEHHVVQLLDRGHRLGLVEAAFPVRPDVAAIGADRRHQRVHDAEVVALAVLELEAPTCRRPRSAPLPPPGTSPCPTRPCRRASAGPRGPPRRTCSLL